ncbi:hypothetical protein ZWY2020_014444 [Hordeum vulgare]|nr:hypothetical protein ZWY2020_014444 [Hordeum vulgare]
MSTILYRWLLELELDMLMRKVSAAEHHLHPHFISSHHPAEAMASSGAVAAMLKNKMLVSCVMLLVVVLMAAQMAAAAAGDDGAAPRRLLDACRYRNCNCRTCPIFNWACCGLCCPPA